MSPPSCETISSRKRLACRALRATSLMPFLWSSSSSSVTIGRNTSCSSKRKRLVGSCISTFVSSTKSLVAAVFFCGRGPSRSRLRCMGTSGGEAKPDVSSAPVRAEESLRGSLGISSWEGGGERSLERRRADEIEHFLRVAGNLHPAPLPGDAPLPVDHEGAALDAADLPPVHVLHLHHAEDREHLPVGIREELEGEGHLPLEFLVRSDRVARDAEHRHARVDELGVEVAELPAFVGASGRVVARIEVEDE